MLNLKNDFDYIRINLASPKRIKEWGERILPNGQLVGEVTKPDTINYRTFKPDVDGLFCEKIFGPIKNWECYCGKHKRFKPKELLICERCGVEVTEARVRRHRMGYIELATPVVHVWYLKGIPSYLSLLLKLRVRVLEEIVYFNRFFHINPKNFREFKDSFVKNVDKEEVRYSSYERELYHIENKYLKIGGDAILYLLKSLDLNTAILTNRMLLSLADAGIKVFENKETIKSGAYKETREKITRRIRLIENFLATGSDPSWMMLQVIPVIPPGLRPMVQLDSGRFATSDLNELYRRVITRNTRLSRLAKLYAPSIVLHNEKRLLQEAIDTLIDNGKRGRKVLGLNNRPLKSLSDVIEGKHGRFRQNLLGKRVDYSGRSVIVVGPSLRLNQCGLPHEIALELFQPFIIHHLVKNGLAVNLKFAKKLIRTKETIVWQILQNILKTHPVLLNRAPTLHRLGIQAFEPILIPGRAIQLHPLVCTAFNADFDGDQMAIHLPLSLKAQYEAKSIMLPSSNMLSPATGEPIILPTQDMILGCYYLTLDNPLEIKLSNHYFSNDNDAFLAYIQQKLLIHTPVWIRKKELKQNKNLVSSEQQLDKYTNSKYIRTTIGRILLNKTVSKNLNS